MVWKIERKEKCYPNRAIIKLNITLIIARNSEIFYAYFVLVFSVTFQDRDRDRDRDKDRDRYKYSSGSNSPKLKVRPVHRVNATPSIQFT